MTSHPGLPEAEQHRPTIDPGLLYRVDLVDCVPIGGVPLGPDLSLQLTGQMLAELLAGEHAAGIGDYEPVSDAQ